MGMVCNTYADYLRLKQRQAKLILVHYSVMLPEAGKRRSAKRKLVQHNCVEDYYDDGQGDAAVYHHYARNYPERTIIKIERIVDQHHNDSDPLTIN